MPVQLSLRGLLALVGGLLALVALTLHQGGPVESASDGLAEVARKTAPGLRPTPVASRSSMPREWYAPEPGVVPVAPVRPVAAPPVEGAPPTITLRPPPTGPDFPPPGP